MPAIGLVEAPVMLVLGAFLPCGAPAGSAWVTLPQRTLAASLYVDPGTQIGAKGFALNVIRNWN